MWLLNPKTGVVNLVFHADTIKRCLSEGHVEVDAPAQASPGPARFEATDHKASSSVAPEATLETHEEHQLEPKAKRRKRVNNAGT